MMSMPSKRKQPVPSPPTRKNSLTIFYALPETMEIKTISVNCNVMQRLFLFSVTGFSFSSSLLSFY